ncbi:MAG: AraC family transcriptional regulator [Cyanobacteria bacterium P01_H01_bin.21]
MVVRLTDDDICDLLDQAEQQGECVLQATEFGIQRKIPKCLGEGYRHSLYLRGGLTIQVFNGQFWQPIITEQQHEETFPITAKFYLSGGIGVKTDNVPDIAADYEEAEDRNYLYYLPDLAESEVYPSNTPIQTIMVYASADYFQALNPTDNELPQPLQRLMQAKRFHQPLGPTTPAMNQILQQIIHCPYQGATQQLYLESKAIELLALQFACLEAAPGKYTLNKADLEQVRYARDILVSRLCNPPSLTELARSCGLNDFKLKQGFHQMFGTTVFGYLYDYRMKYAQELLRDDYLSVAIISAKVGYTSPEAFSVAFRRKFAIGPKAYQLSQRGKD